MTNPFVTVAGTCASALLVVGRAGMLGEAELTLAQAMAKTAVDIALATRPQNTPDNRTLTAEALAAEVFDTVAAPAPFDIKLEEVNSPHLSATLQKFSYGLRATGLVLAVEALDIVSQEEALSLAQAVSVKDRAALTSAIDTITALPQAMKLAAEGFDVPEDIAVALDRWAGGLVTNGGIINLIWDLSKAPNDIFANRLRGIIGDGRRPRAVTDLGMEAA